MSKTTRKEIKLVDVRTDVLNGRKMQDPDAKQVAYLLSLLDVGIPFADPILVTSDNVVIGGQHRTEAYRQYAANTHAGDPQAFADFVVLADVLPMSWGDATAAQRAELQIQALTDNAHVGGRPYTAYDVRGLVGQLKNGDSKLTQKEIRSRLASQGVPDAWIIRAFRDLLDSEQQRKLSLARGYRKEGHSIKESLSLAGLPPATDLTAKEPHDRVRHNKIKKAMGTVIRQWETMYKEHHSRYETGFPGGSITQQQYKNLAVTMKTEVLRLQRKADSISRDIEKHLQESAGRIRSVGASEKLPPRTF
jgi:hypothetical protein